MTLESFAHLVFCESREKSPRLLNQIVTEKKKEKPSQQASEERG
jgi:hypothetical protein